MTLAGIVQLLCQRGQVISLSRRRPIDAEPSTPRQDAMHDHDGAAVAIQERMTIREIAHDLAGLCCHGFLVLPVSESKFYRAPNVLWASKQNVALADRKVRSCREAVLSRPRVDGVEENSVRLDHIRIRKMFDLGEKLKGRVNTGRECGMLEAPDDFRVLFLGEVTQVS